MEEVKNKFTEDNWLMEKSRDSDHLFLKIMMNISVIGITIIWMEWVFTDIILFKLEKNMHMLENFFKENFMELENSFF
jgi:hypothetical protein